MSQRKFSFIDNLMIGADEALRTLNNTLANERPSPAATQPEPTLNERERKHVAGLMRINHAGEVCAQALYRGQAASLRDAALQKELQQAAAEEADHLAWCAQRLRELKSRPSRLNPFWYIGSWTLGMGAGLLGKKINLGFLAATEEQVTQHLSEHLEQLPSKDQKSRAIVAQMLKEESAHAQNALHAGGMRFHPYISRTMYWVSRLMVFGSYRV